MPEMSWEMFFQMMIVEEKAARDKYALALEQTDSPELKKVFARLRDEEAVHAEVLEGEYERLAKRLRA